uniref:hypothetical protein n=1 Tax=Phascolarctobacterium faecium TaxID=33025 RepID=UPI003AB37F36
RLIRICCPRRCWILSLGCLCRKKSMSIPSDKKDNKVKEEVNTTEDQHKMRELVDELLKKNK